MNDKPGDLFAESIHFRASEVAVSVPLRLAFAPSVMGGQGNQPS